LKAAGGLRQEGALDLAAAVYRDLLAASEGPQRYAPLLGLARTQADLGHMAAAEQACREAVAADPARPTAFAMLALALVALERLDEAAQAAEEARRRARLDSGVLNLASSIALQRGRTDEARTLSERALEVDPHDQRAISDLLLIHRQKGDEAAARRLIDAPGLIALLEPPLPAGVSDADSLNAALEAAILAHPALQAPRGEAAMIGGRRLTDVFSLPLPLSQALRAMFTAALDAYEAGLPLDPDHPVTTGKPSQRRLVGWANVVGPGDHERAHIHEAGWVSGVYYVRTPTESGAILLGGHHHDGLTGADPIRTIQPAAGQLLLFPSYLHHRTTPFAGSGTRISIAFDVMRD
jgi:tetratricopeptide (TPR) repeat protein